jgi:hypothetical protein
MAFGHFSYELCCLCSHLFCCLAHRKVSPDVLMQRQDKMTEERTWRTIPSCWRYNYALYMRAFFLYMRAKPIAHAQRVKPVTSESSTPIVCPSACGAGVKGCGLLMFSFRLSGFSPRESWGPETEGLLEIGWERGWWITSV